MQILIMKPKEMAHLETPNIYMGVNLKLLISKKRFAEWIKLHTVSFPRLYITG
jgi:hydrogenase maturation factor